MIFTRLIEQIGPDNFQKLQDATVLILGIGGVGGHCAEALARSGVGTLILVDKDDVEASNINRQIIAFQSTIGRSKVALMEKRIKDINPAATVITHHTFYDFETKQDILTPNITFICDCIDTITFKIDVIKDALERQIPIISSMGAGNKRHPELLEISELSKTSYCPVAKVIRTKLRKEQIHGTVPVVYSKEEPNRVLKTIESPSSNSFVPATAGLLMASYVVNNIIA